MGSTNAPVTDPPPPNTTAPKVSLIRPSRGRRSLSETRSDSGRLTACLPARLSVLFVWASSSERQEENGEAGGNWEQVKGMQGTLMEE